MGWNQIAELRQRKAKVLAEARSILEKAEKENRSINAEETSQYEAAKKDIDVLDKRIANLSAQYEMETRASEENPEGSALKYAAQPVQAPKFDNKKEEQQYRDAFQHYVLTGERRDVLTTSQGVVAPGYFNDSYLTAVKSALGVLQNGATTFETPDMNPFYLPTLDDTGNTAQVGAEGFTASAETDPTLGSPYLGAWRYTPGPLAYTIEMAKSNFLGFEKLIQNMAVTQVQRKLNTDTTIGNGTSKCKGFLQGATVGKTAVSVSTFTYAEVIDLIYSLDPYYRLHPSTRIFGSAAALQIVRKFADSQSRPLFSPNEPLKIENIPFVENVDMPAVSTGNAVLAIVRCDQYYFRSVSGVEVIVDPYTKASQGKRVVNVIS